MSSVSHVSTFGKMSRIITVASSITIALRRFPVLANVVDLVADWLLFAIAVIQITIPMVTTHAPELGIRASGNIVLGIIPSALKLALSLGIQQMLVDEHPILKKEMELYRTEGEKQFVLKLHNRAEPRGPIAHCRLFGRIGPKCRIMDVMYDQKNSGRFSLTVFLSRKTLVEWWQKNRHKIGFQDD